MLIQFRFQNFKSFRDEAIFDFTSTGISDHPDHVIQLGDEEILPIVAIYGANASGKSNVFEAFRYMKKYVTESFAYGGEEQEDEVVRRAKFMPFLFDGSSNHGESLFEVYFIKENENGCMSYNYGFTMNQDRIAEEWLNAKHENESEYGLVFYRENGNLDLSGIADSKTVEQMIFPSLYEEVLVVSLGAKLKIEELKLVRDLFVDCKLCGYGDPIENVFLSTQIPKEFADDQSVQSKTVRYLATFDQSIVGFNVQKMENEEEESRVEHVKIDAIHNIANSSETVSIPLQEESDGTLKMFSMYPVLEYVLKRGGVLLVDELNAKLHPLLVRLIIILFLDKETNPKHAQLVFTTHDAWQLSNRLFRKDEIWFTDKDVSTGAFSLYSLSEFEEDEEEPWNKTSYEEDYLVGKYGGIPNLSKFDAFKEE